ncbi:oligopeptide ABC transporter ATP-binding protein (plasmid) [Ketogulonicigenium vulgare Y25]|uniref:ABC transporter ATP-binding protein n=1 Tax=Ketogulonicigenium vulgare TaxID=92945 RepID=UPI0001E66F54|nr:ABC transporter ATP-binding protein [Ketogulonicigenium vulgare]ADO44273.1 oligopeptide ABC transporter ATP-binding protein [Ketogulonicigenium vulgare Y25]
MSLLHINELRLAMQSYRKETEVLHGISLTVERGQIWGLVGETGSGKSLTGLSTMRLVPSPPGRYLGGDGQILFEGEDLLQADERRMRALRGRRMGMIFQDPTTNLNPVFRIGTQMVDAALHAAGEDPSLLGLAPGAGRRDMRRAARETAIQMLAKVGIPNPESRIDDYAHQFSGGMRQRVLIAMAMIGKPDLLIADEPTTALDVSIQAQILRLIHDLVLERNIGCLLITHNLGVVAQVCTHVAVMFRGRVLESGPVAQVLKQPEHAYTRALMGAIPTADTPRGGLRGLAGVDF